MESTSLLHSTSAESETHVHISNEKFRTQACMLIALLAPLPFIVHGLSSSLHPHWMVWSLGLVLQFAVSVFLVLLLHGFYIWQRGPLPLKPDEEATYLEINEADDKRRTVEYFVWGSERADATPLVCLHGSGTTGKDFNQFLFPPKVVEKLNVKVISPSFPGHGGSDVQAYRRISEWPLTDLKPILLEESITGKFLVIGTSYGTAHAMATAACFPQRCQGMGLNVPYLPETICREFGFWTDADMILREKQLERPWILLPLLSVLSMVQFLIPQGLDSLKEAKEVKKEIPEMMNLMKVETARSFLRGVNGQAYEMTNAETTQSWQDPREITVPHVCVWYAQDDGAVPPAHGEWLADLFRKKEAEGSLQTVHVRSEKLGLGHFTYMKESDRQTAVMTKVLLEMVNGT